MRLLFFFSSRRRHTSYIGDWSSDVCSSDLTIAYGHSTPTREIVLQHASIDSRSDCWRALWVAGNYGVRELLERKVAGNQILVRDRKSTRLNSSHRCISYAVFCLKKKIKKI